jgi:signal transduction histidine kinase
MRAGGQVLGVLSILGKAGQQFTEEEVVLLASIADQVGVAVENGLLYRQTEQLAVMEERSRLARELHDSVTQSLYSLTLYAEVGRRAAEAGDLQHVVDYLAQLGQVAQQTLKEMRSLVFELRPMALETEGLGGALQQRLDAVEKRAGVEAHLIVEGMGELSTIMEEGLYRIAQEALNNVLKHAGASVVTVRINSHGDWVELEVRDNGRAFDPANIDHRGGVGLTSMRERAEQLGGSFTISSRSGEGTMVKAKIPTRRSWSRPVLPVDILVEVAS